MNLLQSADLTGLGEGWWCCRGLRQRRQALGGGISLIIAKGRVNGRKTQARLQCKELPGCQFAFCCCKKTLVWGRQGVFTLQIIGCYQGKPRQELKAALSRDTGGRLLTGLLPSVLFGYLSYTAQVHLLRDGTKYISDQQTASTHKPPD